MEGRVMDCFNVFCRKLTKRPHDKPTRIAGLYVEIRTVYPSEYDVWVLRI
jgi:hypothetical protein